MFSSYNNYKFVQNITKLILKHNSYIYNKLKKKYFLEPYLFASLAN